MMRQRGMFKTAHTNRFFLSAQKGIAVLVVLTLLFAPLEAWLLDVFSIELGALPDVVTVEAATGDFATFTETGQNTIDATGVPYDLTWSSTVDSNSNIALQANSSDIDLADGGKYFVMYNSFADEGSAGGSNRRSISSYLTVAGNQIAYGRGAGYSRDSESWTDAYAAGAAIIDATAGDDLQLHVQRDDTNSGAGLQTTSGVNGVSVLKLPDGNDYFRARYTATSSSISGNTAFTDVDWNTADEVDTDSFGFTATSANITLKGDDGAYFMANVNVGLYVSGGGTTRQNYEMRLTLDGTEIPGTRVTSYLRGTNDTWYGQLAYTGLIAKTASGDQTLNVEVRRESSGGATTVIMNDKTGISLMAVPSTADVVRLTDNSGTQTTSNSATTLTFDTQDEIKSGVYSHSTTTNAGRVEIDAADDYLFFATAYTETTTSGNNRQPFRMFWQKTGVTQGRNGFGSLNRANSTFTGGASNAILFSGLGTSDYISLSHIDETSNAPVDATFAADRVALQGIALNDNFFGLDTEVSASGTHIANVDIPTNSVYTGGQFVIQENSASRNVTNITINESGSINGSTALKNIELYYDLDTTAPYDCASESFVSTTTESQYGSTDSNGFSGADGSSSFNGSVAISPTQALCIYPVMDIASTSNDGDTIELSINNPITDVAVTGGGVVGPSDAQAISASTTVRNAELTMTHYRWLNDDGVEGSATAIEDEDTPAVGFANGTVRRLRAQIDAAGSTSSLPTTFRLDYATKTAACSILTDWVDVGAAGGDWSMSASTFITDGTNATNIGTGSGGVSDPAGASFLSTNSGLRDTNSQTGSLTLASNQFVEFEFAIEPTATAPQGNTYCFRFSDSGTELQNYDVYAEGTISADIDVSATGTASSTIDVGAVAAYTGGGFVIERPGGNRTVTSITVTEVGTIDGATNVSNVRLRYDLDTTAPYDCTGESYSAADTIYGSVDSDGFSAANGSSTFTGSVSVNSTQSMCVYVEVDIGSGASNGETLDIQISDPSMDVVVTSSSVGPSSAIGPTGSSTITGPIKTQTHYHWRNDDGDETDGGGGATSASGGVDDTAITEVPQESTRRLRIQVSNEGTVSTAAINYRIEYGTKITTCDAVGSWVDVGDVGGAWDMSLSSNIADGNTTNIAESSGGMPDENTTLVGTGALRETTSESGAITLTSTEFTELEYSIEATLDSGFDTTYCFRVTDSGTPLESYSVYAELTTREKQDFFIQRGTEQVSGTSLTLTAGVDYTAPSATTAAFVRITNSGHTGAGNDTGGGNTNTDDFTAYISDQTDITSSFTIARPAAAISSTRVAWEIVEFVGIAGTDNEMIVRDTGTVAMAASSLFATGTSATSTDDQDIVVFVTGHINDDSGRTNVNDGHTTASWNAASNEPVFERAESDTAVDVSYAVVEFTGANWSVERVEHTYTAAGSAEIESITAVPSVTQAFVHAQKRVGSGDNGLDEAGHRVWVSSVGAVSFQLRSGATTPTAHVSVAWVVSNTQTGSGALSVQQTSGTIVSGGPEPNSNILSIGVTVNTANSSIFATNDSAGTGTAYPRPFNLYTIASSTDFELWQSDTGQNVDYRADIVEWPVADTSVRQNYYRFYVDNDLIDPTDPWPTGATDLGENTSITGSDDPLGEGERVRIRMTLLINNATLPAAAKAFKLQYGLRVSTCSAITVWSDIGDPGDGTIWRGFNTSLADGTELATSTPAPGRLNISISDVAGTFEEQNNSAINPYSVDLGEDVEYDWVIEHNGAAQQSDYCFRMTESDGTELAGYINYPTIRTTGYTPVVGDWRWYGDETSETPSTALAAENTAPTDIANGDPMKLRVVAEEVEGAPGQNVKFRLQYSEYANFSDGGTFVVASSSCTATSTWCYADGGGTDNATITTAVISTADACVAESGNGCGTYNEFPTTTSSHGQAANSNMEFDFTIRSAGPRVGGVYYFRLYDVVNGDPLAASTTFPSVVTESGSLTFDVTGVGSGVSTEGITTDVATTPTSIPFGDIVFDTEYEAAYRLSVDTNATEGYQMFMYARQDMLDAYGNRIEPISGTNASPLAWGSGCSVSNTGCIGYHTGDDTLSDGSTRFSPNDTYAQFSTTTLEEIIYTNQPAVSESTDIIFKIRVNNQQPAGQYQKEVVFISVPIY